MLYEIITFLFWPILIYITYKATLFALKKYDAECIEEMK